MTSAVTVCLLAMNKAQFTRRCLASLELCRFPPASEVVLVDNGSTDETLQLFLAFQHAMEPIVRVVIVLNAVNRGCPGGRNMAAAVATAPYLLFLDNDLWIEDVAIVEKTSRFLVAHHDVGVMGGHLVLSEPLDGLQCAGVELDERANVSYRGEGMSLTAPEFSAVADVQGVAGACFAINTVLFRKLGGFDEAYHPVNYEDLDLCFRVRARGLRVVANPDVKVFHTPHATTHHTASLSIRRVNVRNQALFRQRWEAMLAQEASTRGGLNG